MRMTQGKCVTCETRHKWPSHRGTLREVLCPWCGRHLQRTTKMLRWPVAIWDRMPRTVHPLTEEK